MATITIRERSSVGPKGESATISFDNGPLYDITISVHSQSSKRNS